MTQQIDSPSIIEFYYTDEDTGIRRVEPKTDEKYLIQDNGLVFLSEHPQESMRLTVKNQGKNIMTEVLNEDEVSYNTYYVDYVHDKIKFDISRKEEIVYVSYYSTGCVCLSASRVVARLGENVTETIQDIIDGNEDFVKVQTEYSSAYELIEGLTETKDQCISALNNKINSKEQEVQDKIDEVDTKINDINDMVTNCEVTCFAGKLNNTLTSIMSGYGYINKGGCFATENGELTFTAPIEGVYEFDGRATSLVAGNMSASAMIGEGWLFKIIGQDYWVGETIRFNNTYMMLNEGQKVKINTISDNIVNMIDNVHFSIKYLADFDKSIADCVKPLFAGKINDDLLTVKNGYINKNGCVKDSSNSGYQYLTFIAPKRGVYEIDGRCTANIAGSLSANAKIGTLNDTSGYLLNVVGKDAWYGETIRFNNTFMLLDKGQVITLWGISENISDNITNVHFKIQYVGQPT